MELTTTITGDKKASHVNPKHTIRDDKFMERERYTSADKSKKDDNIILINHTDISIKDFVNKTFQPYVDEYNSKQKRSDRKITDYYEKAMADSRGKGDDKRLMHEMILQIGNSKNDNLSFDEQAQILKNVFENIEEEYPELEIYAAAIHMDEQNPHLHIDFIPMADGYKKGLSCQCSLTKFCSNNGFQQEFIKKRYVDKNGELASKSVLQSAYATFMERGIRPLLEQELLERNITIIHQKERHAHEDIDEFKKREEIKSINKEKDMAEFDLVRVQSTLRTQKEQLKEVEEQVEELEEKKDTVNQTIVDLNLELTDMKNTYKKAKKLIEEKDQIIVEKDKIIKEKDNVIEQKSKFIDELKDKIEHMSVFQNLIDAIKDVKPNFFKKLNFEQTHEIKTTAEFIVGLGEKAFKYDKNYADYEKKAEKYDSLLNQNKELKEKLAEVKMQRDIAYNGLDDSRKKELFTKCHSFSELEKYQQNLQEINRTLNRANKSINNKKLGLEI